MSDGLTDATVLVNAAVCLGCGYRMVGVYWDGDTEDDRRFPVEMPVDHLRAVLGEGCFHCGGQIQVEVLPAAPTTEAVTE